MDGKKSTLDSGRGRSVGPDPVPTALPTPRKLFMAATVAAVAVAATALAASLFLLFCWSRPSS